MKTYIDRDIAASEMFCLREKREREKKEFWFSESDLKLQSDGRM